MRAILNVPIKDGQIQDDFRIEAMLPTIKYLNEQANKLVIIAHLGRPAGNFDPAKHSLKPVAARLGKLLKKNVIFIPDCRGEEVKKQIYKAPDKAIILLENLRKYQEERANDETFGKELATYADVFIQDAFGDVYGEYASVIWPPQVLPSAIGYRIKYEMENLDKLRKKPERPFTVLIGGTKIKEKLGAVMALGKKADHILVGGGIANTIYAAGGVDLKDSFLHKEEFDIAKEVMGLYPDKIILPHDFLVAGHSDGEHYDKQTIRITQIDGAKEGESVLDIGPSTLKKYLDICRESKSIFWAGTMGYFEWEPAARGSVYLAKALVDMDNYVAVGGGETAIVFDQAGIAKKIDYVSTGGGAALQYLSGEELPGLAVIK